MLFVDSKGDSIDTPSVLDRILLTLIEIRDLLKQQIKE